MSEKCQGSVSCSCDELREALSVHTRKITDSCRDKDCIEDLRVYLTRNSQAILDDAAGAKVRCGDLLYTSVEVEPVAFDRNHWCIDVTFYYRILADAVVGCARPAALYGLAVFSKRAVLCGEESKAHIFTSESRLEGPDCLQRFCGNKPTAVVEVLDPMILSSRVCVVADGCCKENTLTSIPACIAALFDEELVLSGESRRLFVTLGQFSVIRLERDAQLVVPVLDYSLPTKECCDTPGCAEDPCEMFSRIPFPVRQFTPGGCDRQEISVPDACDCYTTTSGC